MGNSDLIESGGQMQSAELQAEAASVWCHRSIRSIENFFPVFF